MSEQVIEAEEVEREPSQALVKAAEARLAKAEPGATPSITDQRIVAVGAFLKEIYSKASDLQLTAEEQAKLAEPFPDDVIEILPTGELYVPHILIRERLGQALGAGQWSIVGLEHNVDGNTIHIHFIMTCRKFYVGESWVSKDYVAKNPRSSWSDTIEGAEGEAVRRIAAKRLNCGNQVWKPAFGRVWIPKYAVQVWRKKNKEKGPQWRRKDCAPFYDEEGNVTGPVAPTPRTPEPQPAPVAVPASEEPWPTDDEIPGLEQSSPETPLAEPGYGKDEWGPIVVPFGKDKDATFGSLTAKQLWWWFMVWSIEPLKPREWNGKTYPIKDSDQQLWRLLNKHRKAAAAHYQFKPATK